MIGREKNGWNWKFLAFARSGLSRPASREQCSRSKHPPSADIFGLGFGTSSNESDPSFRSLSLSLLLARRVRPPPSDMSTTNATPQQLIDQIGAYHADRGQDIENWCVNLKRKVGAHLTKMPADRGNVVLKPMRTLQRVHRGEDVEPVSPSSCSL